MKWPMFWSVFKISNLNNALWVELYKVGKSRTLWLTALVFIILALLEGLFTYISKDPDMARRLGLLGAKAQIMAGTADWPSYFNQFLLMTSVGGLIVFGFIYIWIFGREFTDKTCYDLLSVPTSRSTTVLAKIMVGTAWSLVLCVISYLLILVIGIALDLPGWSNILAGHNLIRLLVTGGLTIILAWPFGMVVCLWRSYLPAFGCLFGVLVLAQVFNTLGYSQFFPWAIPALSNGLAAQSSLRPEAISYILVFLVGLAGAAATVWWWEYHDQH